MTIDSATEPLPERSVDIVLVTGLSGAGKSTAAKVFEDLGYYVIDNLPPELIATVVDLGARTSGSISKFAVVSDVRSRAFFSGLHDVVVAMERSGIRPSVLFLAASDDALVRRFESVRRAHPLQGDGRIVDGIAAERELLRAVQADADIVIDTSTLSVHDLRRKVEEAFDAEVSHPIKAIVMSFGFKYGLPLDADLVVDARFLPNPHWIPELRPLTGRDPAVRDYVLGQPGASEFLATTEQLLDVVTAGYRREGKRFFTIAIGCTGGKHRSVALAERLSVELAAGEFSVRTEHRDLGKE